MLSLAQFDIFRAGLRFSFRRGLCEWQEYICYHYFKTFACVSPVRLMVLSCWKRQGKYVEYLGKTTNRIHKTTYYPLNKTKTESCQLKVGHEIDLFSFLFFQYRS